jgi:hypothetical protein
MHCVSSRSLPVGWSMPGARYPMVAACPPRDGRGRDMDLAQLTRLLAIRRERAAVRRRPTRVIGFRSSVAWAMLRML